MSTNLPAHSLERINKSLATGSGLPSELLSWLSRCPSRNVLDNLLDDPCLPCAARHLNDPCTLCTSLQAVFLTWPQRWTPAIHILSNGGAAARSQPSRGEAHYTNQDFKNLQPNLPKQTTTQWSKLEAKSYPANTVAIE